MFVILLFCLLPSASFAADLQGLVSASNDFEVEMIEHEHVLERSPSATELAASTFKYARAKERYFVELRKGVPTLIDMATGKRMCCNLAVEPKVGVDDRIFSSSQRTDRELSDGANRCPVPTHFQKPGLCGSYGLLRSRRACAERRKMIGNADWR